MRKIFAILFLLLLNLNYVLAAQFLSYKKAEGNKFRSGYVYKYPTFQNDEIDFDFDKNQLRINDKVCYEILERPEKWIVKFDHRYVEFGLLPLDDTFEKCFVRIIYYDNDSKTITIKTNQKAIRYFIKPSF